MKKREARQLFINLRTLGELKGVKFAYGITKNINKLKPEIEALDKALEPTKEFQEFDKKRVELVKKHSRVDENGKPILKEDNNYDVVNMGLFEKEFEELKKENQEVWDARLAQIEEFNKLLDEEINIEFYKIKLENVPENISTAQMSIITELIEG